MLWEVTWINFKCFCFVLHEKIEINLLHTYTVTFSSETAKINSINHLKEINVSQIEVYFKSKRKFISKVYEAKLNYLTAKIIPSIDFVVISVKDYSINLVAF